MPGFSVKSFQILWNSIAEIIFFTGLGSLIKTKKTLLMIKSCDLNDQITNYYYLCCCYLRGFKNLYSRYTHFPTMGAGAVC